MTVSSFNTLSLDPPLVLWSLALSAPSLADILAGCRLVEAIMDSGLE